MILEVDLVERKQVRGFGLGNPSPDTVRWEVSPARTLIHVPLGC